MGFATFCSSNYLSSSIWKFIINCSYAYSFYDWDLLERDIPRPMVFSPITLIIIKLFWICWSRVKFFNYHLRWTVLYSRLKKIHHNPGGAIVSKLVIWGAMSQDFKVRIFYLYLINHCD